MDWKFRWFHTAVMSCLLSFLMTLWVTLINLGWISGFLGRWLQAWLLAWPAAFVCTLLLGKPALWISQIVWNVWRTKS